MNRKHFLQTVLGTLLAASLSQAAPKRPPRILLRSSWQVVNIGDIAHTPGVLALIEKHIPGAEVVLWASYDLSEEVMEMVHKRFPKLKIVKGTIGKEGKGSNADLEEALQWADFLLHGSGPSLVAAKDVAAWAKHIGKPFGVYGITYGNFFDANRKELMDQAKFLYFRDSHSLAHAKSQGIQSPVMEFGPDGAFACDLRNDAKAEAFLNANGLEEGKFLCCLSRLRYTPYWTIPSKKRKMDPERHATNEKMKEHDHKELRNAIIAVARETPLKVLLCPEDMTQMAVGKAMFYDQLPCDVRPRVVLREDFWLTDQALSTYVRSAGLFGSEMHSPIMALGNGVPAIVCRFKEQTSKGYMWEDIGLGDWLFDLDKEEDHKRIVPTVLDMATNRAAAMDKVAKARAFVEKRQRETMGYLAKTLA
jgi:polysaccharide pyruvyl transferase WcaK-like protein